MKPLKELQADYAAKNGFLTWEIMLLTVKYLKPDHVIKSIDEFIYQYSNLKSVENCKKQRELCVIAVEDHCRAPRIVDMLLNAPLPEEVEDDFGWIKISSERDLPKEDTLCDLVVAGFMYQSVRFTVFNKTFVVSYTQHIQFTDASHYAIVERRPMPKN